MVKVLMGSCLKDREFCQEIHCLDYTEIGETFCEQHRTEKTVKKCGYLNKHGDHCVNEVWTGHCAYHQRVIREEEIKKERQILAAKELAAKQAKKKKAEEREKQKDPLHKWLSK